MVILHIAKVGSYAFSGVTVVVPQHVRAQGEYAETALLNISDVAIEGIEQFTYRDGLDIATLPAPFNKPDLAVFHETYIPQYLKIRKNLKKNKIPYIILPHGDLRKEAQKKKWLKKKAANFLLFNRFIRGAAAIQCLSQKEMENTKFGKEKIIGTNGIFMPSVRKQSFHEGGLTVTYIGRLEWQVKGLDILLDGALLARAELERANIKIQLYGPDYQGRYAHVEQMLAERELENLVTLHREITGQEKENVLLESDVFIQTSRHEGMPMGILEAMSYGVPCLITEGTTLRAFVEENDAGWTADTSAEGVAQALRRLTEEKQSLQEKSANARAAVEKHFSWQNVAKGTVERYGDILRR